MPPFAGRTRGIGAGTRKELEDLSEKTGFDIFKYKGIDRRVILRNCVEPELGKHILDWALKPYHRNGQLFADSEAQRT